MELARGNLEPANLADQARPRNRRPNLRVEGFDAFRTTYGLAWDAYVIVLDAEGTLAICPRCHQTNLLTAGALDVVATGARCARRGVILHYKPE